jgi:hypothetical protein
MGDCGRTRALRIQIISKGCIIYFPDVRNNDALAEWLRRVPAKYMGFPRESSNLSGVECLFIFFYYFASLMLREMDC